MHITDISEIDNLSTPEKILLVEDIWDNIAVDEAGVPIPHRHKQELDRRLRRYKSHPGKLLSFKELQEEVNLKETI